MLRNRKGVGMWYFASSESMIPHEKLKIRITEQTDRQMMMKRRNKEERSRSCETRKSKIICDERNENIRETIGNE